MEINLWNFLDSPPSKPKEASSKITFEKSHDLLWKKKENVHATINHSRDRVSGALDKIQLAHHYKSRQPLYPNRSYPWGTLETSIRKRRKPALLRGWIHPAAPPPSPSSLSLSHPNQREVPPFFFSLFSSASRGYRGRMIDNRSCRTCRRLAYPTKMNSFCAQS